MKSVKDLIKVGITGQSGFVGGHLFNFLGTKSKQIKLIHFNRNFFKTNSKLQKFVKSCDIIVHTAAMNRHVDENVIYNTNMDLVNKLVEACRTTKSRPKFIFTSSTQENINNLYGKSKLDGRIVFENWAKQNKGMTTTLIIPNVFGPFGKPYYNSFIATFSNQIIEGETPNIILDKKVDLIYINELVNLIYDEIIREVYENINLYVVPHTSSKKVSEILNILIHFKNKYIDSNQIPKLELNSFELNLFNTFLSYIPKDIFPRKFTLHEDNRGIFVEIIQAACGGQTSYSTTKPGITRGNHYHTRKIERFAVISGKASIKIRKINTEKVYEFILDGNNPSFVDMPIWFTHNITNIGNTELITLFWINEPYNPEDPDTYIQNV